MLTLQACEKKGVQTVLLTPEWGGKNGSELPLVFSLPEAKAIVSTGSQEREAKLPKPRKVIGAVKGELIRREPDEPPYSPWDKFERDGWYDITGGIDWFGLRNIAVKEY